MHPILRPVAEAEFLGVIPIWLLATVIPVLAVALFAYVIMRRLEPLVKAKTDPRFDRKAARTWHMIKFAFGQYRQPRYWTAGVLHIAIFAGFLILSVRSVSLVILGVNEGFAFPLLGPGQALGDAYTVLKDIAATIVLIACVAAAIRRGIIKPARYAVPPELGHEHTAEAVLILGMISGLMLADGFFEGSAAAAYMSAGGANPHLITPLTIPWFTGHALAGLSGDTLQGVHNAAYLIHEVIFFSFLNVLPLGKHFHVITSIPNVWLAKLNKGSVKPVEWGKSEEEIMEMESVGVKKVTDFTWKHILDFYTCADCGRCSDQCPANAVGRPLSPRFVSIKCRDHLYKVFPLRGKGAENTELIGGPLSEDEVWSCTTCGACENECPIFIEYIDKMVDLRRGMVDEGMVPQSLQKPLSALEKRGNPYGKMEKKRADWAKDCDAPVKVVNVKKGETVETLYFVDSITSYDDAMCRIGQSVARVLAKTGEDWGILGPAEKDSGHEVRRFGEEMLFMDLRDQNTEAIEASGAKKIVTADPHAYNALKKDYTGLPPVEHIATTILRGIKEGKITPRPLNDGKTYVYHDPCYLGRHNDLYDDPRAVLDAIPGLKRAEMTRSRDTSFCCGGGGLMLFYEPVEETRMGRIRVEMAREAGADVVVTACPFCKVNIEDAIKTSGLEGKMEVMDLVELIDRQTSEPKAEEAEEPEAGEEARGN
ncbi:MAG: (Fe-S)-binding protein [Deltaproteobacteria bacterium]|nr:(Fe-S)-binding protein [Deltaproteobacteria bacterium]